MSMERTQHHLQASIEEVRDDARAAASRVRRRTIDLARDALYACAGTVDLAAEGARRLGRHATDLPGSIIERLRQAPARLHTEFDALATRGRRLVHRLQRDTSLRAASSVARTYDELYALAAERNIEGRSTMTKDELISALRR